jgi:SAM-dependent methyltransferase
MDLPPSPLASVGNFEFEALRWARNYRAALLREFAPFLSGDLVEVGAGIGQMTELLARLPGVRQVLAVEPDPRFCEELRQRLPRQPVCQGKVTDLGRGTACDGIVSTNVLEHIEEDLRELISYASLLSERQGVLCLFVPARQEIYAPLDRDFGHFRRYSKAGLADKLRRAGFEIVRLYYFNIIGYFGWWFSFRLLRKRAFDAATVRIFDRMVFPIVYWLESRISRPPIGQSLLAIARVAKQGRAQP